MTPHQEKMLRELNFKKKSAELDVAAIQRYIVHPHNLCLCNGDPIGERIEEDADGGARLLEDATQSIRDIEQAIQFHKSRRRRG